MFLYTSSNSLNYCGIFILNMFCKCFLFYTGYLFFSDLSFLFNLLTGFLWSMVKAYSVGTSICHTTNILTIYRFWIVQRFKPPSFLFRSSLSRQDFYRWFLRNYSCLLYTSMLLRGKTYPANPSGMMRPNPSGILATSPSFNTQS